MKSLLPFLFFAMALKLDAQVVRLDSSRLPICIIDTRGKTIANEPKIIAYMRVVYQGPGKMNHVKDPPVNYNNAIAIEVRGNSSQSYPQKQYGLELRDSVSGEDIDAPLLGMPAEEDWVLYAPYNDISLLRNALTYQLWNEMGHWGPRTRFCELVLNGDYQGIYLFTESIKRGPDRVAIANLKKEDTSGLELTGGYIMKIDKKNNPADKSFVSKVKSTTGQNITWLFHYPESDDIHPRQENYIHQYIDTVEQVIASPNFSDPVNGYMRYLSIPSFIDYFLLTEFTRNIDAYKASSYFYKEKQEADGGKGKFKAGPVWDYNFAYGNASFCSGAQFTGWMYDGCVPATLPTPVLWRRLLQDPEYLWQVKCRYNELRSSLLDTARLFAWLDRYAFDTLSEAQLRHFMRWKILGTNPGGFNAYVASSYPDEMRRVKNWIRNRLNWMDANLQGTCPLPAARITAPPDPACFTGPRPAVDPMQPFSGVPYRYTGSESLKSLPPGIVRWVLLELRDEKDPELVVDRRAALLRNDSAIVDTNFSTAIYFPNALSNHEYYLSVRYDLAGVMRSREKIRLPSSQPLLLTSLSGLWTAPAGSSLYYDLELYGFDTLRMCFGEKAFLSDSNLYKLGYSGLGFDCGTPGVRFESHGDLGTDIAPGAPGIYALDIFRYCDQQVGFRTKLYLEVFPQPDPVIAGPDAFCPGDTAILSTQGFQHYQWGTGSTSAQIAVYQMGSHSLTVTDANGCKGSAVKSVRQHPDISGEVIAVPGHKPDTCLLYFMVQDSNARYHYAWSNGETTSFVEVPESQWSLVVTDTNGCTKQFDGNCHPVFTQTPARNDQLTIVPNPSDGHFVLQCREDVLQVLLLSSDGRIKCQLPLQSHGLHTWVMQAQDVPPGCYALVLRTRTGTLLKAAVVINGD
jgi:hypothetical protein